MKTETATAIGFYNSFASIMTFAASGLGGLIWSLYGPKAMFITSGIGAGLVVIYLLNINVSIPQENPSPLGEDLSFIAFGL